MGYYKQGDAAKADQIRAAFEKLGVYVGGYDFGRKDVLFFTFEVKGETYLMSSVLDTGLDNIILTHPDYKELELPVEPKFKFKVGDWIVQNDNGTVSQITKTINGKDEYGEYNAYEHTNGYFAACFENEYHIWTVQDAKDGDVLATDNGWTCIFKAFDGCVFSSYCFMDSQKWFYEVGSEAHTLDSRINGNILPATKEQRCQLFAKMKEAGYEWDEKEKELRKIQPHYDIANFKVGMPVMVRDCDEHKWLYTVFGIYNKDNPVYPFVVVNMRGYFQCIPFNKDTEHLLGTTDPCGEEYINW